MVDGVTNIGIGAFTKIQNLKKIVFPKSFEIIDDDFVKGCVSLKKIIIPRSVTCIQSNAFVGCSGLSEIHYRSESKV